MVRTTKLMAMVCAMVCAAALGGCGSDDADGGYESSSAGSGEPGAGLNGCDPATAEDHTGESALEIVNDGF